jgi:erythrin-vacuolar iron transport family protein
MSSTLGIDFSRLTLVDALDLAVLIEEEARDRYLEFGEQMKLHHTPEAASFFHFMSGNEEKHRTELAARRAELFKDAPTSVDRSMLFDVEAPDYDEARASMTGREALQAAMRSETKAYQFFDQALPQITDAGVRKLFEELRQEELEHQDLVQRELDKLPPDPALGADNWEDEPVGH